MKIWNWRRLAGLLLYCLAGLVLAYAVLLWLYSARTGSSSTELWTGMFLVVLLSIIAGFCIMMGKRLRPAQCERRECAR